MEREFATAVATRNFEIDLFWKRSLFFWGFIGAAFVGYAAVREKSANLAIVLGSFGMVCAVAWTFVNRGSKYWQENWEQWIESSGHPLHMMFLSSKGARDDGSWLRGRRYSVSRVAIALSDYVAAVWIALVAVEVVRKVAPGWPLHLWVSNYGGVAFASSSAIFALIMWRCTYRDGKRQELMPNESAEKLSG